MMGKALTVHLYASFPGLGSGLSSKPPRKVKPQHKEECLQWPIDKPFTILTESRCADHNEPLHFEVEEVEICLNPQIVILTGYYRCSACKHQKRGEQPAHSK